MKTFFYKSKKIRNWLSWSLERLFYLFFNLCYFFIFLAGFLKISNHKVIKNNENKNYLLEKFPSFQIFFNFLMFWACFLTYLFLEANFTKFLKKKFEFENFEDWKKDEIIKIKNN